MHRSAAIGWATRATLSVAALLVSWAVFAVPWPPARPAATTTAPSPGFTFTRLQYRSSGGESEAFYYYEGRWWERWETDHPIADNNLLERLKELLALDERAAPQVVDLSDDALFDFPLLYLCDVGWMTVTPAEADRLGSYLRRGGFVWADDFWGYAEWLNFERVMAEALPGAAWFPLDQDHELFDMLFELEELPQIPARDFAQWMTHDPPQIHRQPAHGIETAELRAFTDAEGRVVAIASFNSDVGDGWEREAYGDWFFERFSSKAYAFASNAILYALTH